MTWLLEHSRYEQALDIIESDVTLTQATREQASRSCTSLPSSWNSAQHVVSMHLMPCCCHGCILLLAALLPSPSTTRPKQAQQHQAPQPATVHQHKACRHGHHLYRDSTSHLHPCSFTAAPHSQSAINLSIRLSNQPINQPVSQSANQSIKQSINRSINQPINQPITQPIDQPINQ